MIHGTVVWVQDAQNDLAELWMVGPDREAISAAAYAIDQELADDSLGKGIELSEGLRAYFSPPLRVLYTVREDDRIIEILRVKLL
jgi:plasmid stabilization system protein ParE